MKGEVFKIFKIFFLCIFYKDIMEIKKNEKYKSEIEKVEENKNQEMILITSFIVIVFLIIFFLFFNVGGEGKSSYMSTSECVERLEAQGISRYSEKANFCFGK